VRASCACVAVLALALGSGCAGQQAIKTRRHAELSLGGSLIGVIVSSLGIAAFPDHKPVFIGITAGFGALAVASVIVYGVAHANSPSEEPPPPLPPRPDHRPEAWALTQQAQSAARAGDCERVVALSIQVQMLDADFLATVFLRDAAIGRCLAPSPQ
jgi:hypothetical protein